MVPGGVQVCFKFSDLAELGTHLACLVLFPNNYASIGGTGKQETSAWMPIQSRNMEIMLQNTKDGEWFIVEDTKIVDADKLTYFFKYLRQFPLRDVRLHVRFKDQDLSRLGTNSDSGTVGIPGVSCDTWQDTIDDFVLL